MAEQLTCFNVPQLRATRAEHVPYNDMVASDVLMPAAIDRLRADFPDIREPGFFPEADIDRKGNRGKLSHLLKKFLPFG